MGREGIDLVKDGVLDALNPANLDYEEWVQVGMGLKASGYTVHDWDDWSRQDPARYHDGECEKKWNSFRGGYGAEVTAGTIVQMAKNHGWKASSDDGHAFDWDSFIGDDTKIIDGAWVEGREIEEPANFDPVKELTTYLETLFQADESVGYVTETWEKDGKFLPSKGSYSRTAGQLIQELSRYGNIGEALGDINEKAGAWIRFNPLDGKGVKNENVTEFRYALVESDTLPIDKQNALLRELELPIAALVYSGGKSLHAIVKIDAADYSEYRKRVNYLYEICKKNGLELDTQNKNPSRLSRMPGAIRNGHKQFLVDTNIGKDSWTEWKEWIESVNDDLPDFEGLSEVWDDMPELSPPLIDNILRQGHKMLLAGASKAGKSYLLIELCIAIAEGQKWIQWQCAQGKVLYINLELDRASCLHRFKDVYDRLGIPANNLRNIDIWNLRGKSLPMDSLAPKLIRRAQKKDYLAVIIDPIYKIITGDENSADQMAHFCNQFDKVCTELGCSVIYCHHHSKGSQGQKKAMDRASGSGVFARDPDALIDLLELKMDEKTLLNARYSLQLSEAQAEGLTAWQIDGTLREFPKFRPVNLFFNYPIHQVDEGGVLDEAVAAGDFWSKRKDPDEKLKKAEKRDKDLAKAYEAVLGFTGRSDLKDVSEYLNVSARTVRRWIEASNDFEIENNFMIPCEGKQVYVKIEQK